MDLHPDAAHHVAASRTALVPLLRPGALLPPWAGSILCFHGIDSLATPSQGLVSVTPALFEQILDVVECAWRVIPLRELVLRRQAGRSTAGLIAITFDDAYASLLPEAIPALARRGMPSTIFVVSRASTDGATFWWDRLDDLFPLLSPATWRALEEALGLPAAFRAGQPQEYGPMRPLRQWLLAEHAGRLSPDADALITAAEHAACAGTVQRAMTEGELRQVVGSEGVELGIHTASHPVLPLLSPANQREEILECHAWLRERFTGSVQPLLAIPFGLYTHASLSLAREAGMIASMVLGNRTLRKDNPPAGLCRFCLTSREKPWKLSLRLLGAAEMRQDPAETGPPALPSETT